MINNLLTTDITITRFINNLIPHNAYFDLLFSFFSLKGSSILIWILIVMMLVLFEEKRDKRFIIYFVVSFFATAFVVNIVLKNIFQRPRPQTPNQIANVTCPRDFSFPSGHAATAVAAAVTLSYFDKKRKYFYYLIAALIGLSRIYLYCHFFLDVVGGGLVGYMIGKIILLIKPKGR